MRFTSVQLATHDLAAQRDFYAGTLGLPVQDADGGGVAVQVGSTTLAWDHTDQPLPAPYHIAFRVPGQQFEEAAAWLAARTPVLASADGQTVFVSDVWDARSVYFADGAGNIAEIIAHHPLPATPVTPFGPAGLLSVCELGWPTDDVPARAAQLRATLGLAPHMNQASEEFVAVGDGEGMFIVVANGRGWLPTGAPAAPLPWRATVQAAGGAHSVVLSG